MLSIDFPGRDIVRKQIEGAVVIAECRDEPDVVLTTPKDGPLLRLPSGRLPWGAVPVELTTPPDEPGGAVTRGLLSIQAGRVAELELYRADGRGRVSKPAPPSPDSFELDLDGLEEWRATMSGASVNREGR